MTNSESGNFHGSEEHQWEMINIRTGYIIYESSYPNSFTRCYFSEEEVEPVEEYKEADEFWKFAGSAQSVRYNLKCAKTSKIVKLDELLGIMFPDGKKCGGDIEVLQRISEPQQIFIYLALCFRGAKGEEMELTNEQLQALNEYFNDRLRTPGKKILILPERFAGPPERCFGHILIDVGLTSME
ncbi:MAG: hypothetical protein KAR20_05640 [Candidatus Heimdallarchaeota archaeon]|nr:hypothetical protein [Candidatus Heimdallarchaeota archaeon]